MSHLSKIFQNTKVDVPNLSGRDLSHEVLGSLKCGRLTPILCHELLPAEKVSLGAMIEAQLPPMASNFYGRVDLRMEAFFVPYRILWGGWEAFFTKEPNQVYPQNFGPHPTNLPALSIKSSSAPIPATSPVAESLNQTLLGALRYRYTNSTLPIASNTEISSIKNILPLLAYHKIYDDWYRNSMVEKPLFVRPNATIQISERSSVKYLPYYTYNGTELSASVRSIAINAAGVFTTNPSCLFFNGDHILSWHQRNWAKDRFTTSTLTPQAGAESKVTFSTPDDSGEFTIASLRAANVIQKWLDRNNIAGYRYADQILATFGVLPSDAIVQRPLFLGSTSFHLYNKSVFQQNNPESLNTSSKNPYNSVGSDYGKSRIAGEDSLISSFQAKEHGYLMVIASLVPHAYYSTGCDRKFIRETINDFPDPMLQGLGEQPVYQSEISNVILGSPFDKSTFGYNQQYCESKYIEDYVFGELSDNGVLSSFALKRGFTSDTELGKDFLSIPLDYLSQVKAVSSDISQIEAAWDIDCWFDCFFSFKHVSVLADYVIPTLGDPHIFHKQVIPYRGRQL